MAIYRVVMEYEVTETHRAAVYVDATDEQDARDKAGAINDAGRAPWYLESDSAGGTTFPEVVVVDPAEVLFARKMQHTLAYELPAEVKSND